MDDSNRAVDLDRLYALLGELRMRSGGERWLAECSRSSGWPHRGVYFFFEDGEVRANGEPRVLRVGTHGLRPSKSTLWSRLKQHKGTPGGSLPGGGNHRGSIFRLHVGASLLARDGRFPEIADTWGRGAKAPPGVRPGEYPLEQAVTRTIGALPFLWVAVDDEPSALSARGVIESGAIALLSNLGREPIDPPSNEWLGHHSTRPAVRESGLWNVNHVAGPPVPGFLDVLKHWVERQPHS